MTEQLWILAFDKNTGERRNFVCCPKNNAKFYSTKFEMEGYKVEIMTQDELDEYIESMNK